MADTRTAATSTKGGGRAVKPQTPPPSYIGKGTTGSTATRPVNGIPGRVTNPNPLPGSPRQPTVPTRPPSLPPRPVSNAIDDQTSAADRARAQELAANQGREAAQAAALLADYGLDDLIAIVDQWIRGGMSIDEAMLQLRDPKTDAGRIFDARFPAIQLRRATGLAPISPAEYVAYERQATQILRSAGLPQGFYDSREDFTNLLAGDVSIGELNQRINDGFVAVSRAPAEVRDAFGSFFGANGDAALASFFLDQSKSLPILQEIVDTAQVGGAARQFGFGIDRGRADQIRQTGVGFEQARSGFGTLAALKPVFEETISEAVDLTAEGIGTDAVFGLDQGQGARTVQRRVDERVAAGSGLSGGGAAGERGGFGLGSARR